MILPRSLSVILLGAAICAAACEKRPERAADTGATPTTTGADSNRPNSPSSSPATAPDNTAKNKADSAGDTKTPMDQSETAANVKITAEIRRAIMNEKSMSVNAQNCKIITDAAGLVTLRGVVDSQAEKDFIQTMAKAIAGVTSVDNQLEVKTN